MATIISKDFVGTLRRFKNRSPKPDRLKREILDNIRAIENGGKGDEPSRMYPESRLHVCEGARFGVVYCVVDDDIQTEHLEKIGL